jgi:hypothetical protein
MLFSNESTCVHIKAIEYGPFTFSFESPSNSEETCDDVLDRCDPEKYEGKFLARVHEEPKKSFSIRSIPSNSSNFTLVFFVIDFWSWEIATDAVDALSCLRDICLRKAAPSVVDVGRYPRSARRPLDLIRSGYRSAKGWTLHKLCLGVQNQSRREKGLEREFHRR